jgi:thiol-disulfide isomerase/thioredoxin
MFRTLLTAGILFMTSFAGMAQSHRVPPPPPPANRADLPYMKTRDMPAFNILKSDSVEIFNTFYIPKGRPVALMLFSPDCKHCNELTDRITRGMDSLSEIRFYIMSMTENMTAIRKFAKEHHLEKYKNIEVVGCDYEFFFITHFGAMRVPTIALFDADKKYVDLLESEISVLDLYTRTH